MFPLLPGHFRWHKSNSASSDTPLPPPPKKKKKAVLLTLPQPTTAIHLNEMPTGSSSQTTPLDLMSINIACVFLPLVAMLFFKLQIYFNLVADIFARKDMLSNLPPWYVSVGKVVLLCQEPPVQDMLSCWDIPKLVTKILQFLSEVISLAPFKMLSGTSGCLVDIFLRFLSIFLFMITE